MIQRDITITILILAYVVAFSHSQQIYPLKKQKLGDVLYHTYDSFVILSRSKMMRLDPSFKIMYLFINSLIKTQKSLQIVKLKNSNSIFQLMLLTRPNNFGNNIIIFKDDLAEYFDLCKNLFVNGLQKLTSVYYARTSHRNKISYEFQASYNLNNNNQENGKNKKGNFQTQFTLEYMLEKLHLRRKAQSQQRVHLFYTISSYKQIKQLSRSVCIMNSNQNLTIQMILQIEAPIPLGLLACDEKQILGSVAKINNISIYMLKLSNEATLVFQKVNQNSQFSSKYQSQILEQGVYYITTTDIFIKK